MKRKHGRKKRKRKKNKPSRSQLGQRHRRSDDHAQDQHGDHADAHHVGNAQARQSRAPVAEPIQLSLQVGVDAPAALLAQQRDLAVAELQEGPARGVVPGQQMPADIVDLALLQVHRAARRERRDVVGARVGVVRAPGGGRA